MTQPAQPVHNPDVITSSYSSFHWKVHRSLVPAAMAKQYCLAGSTPKGASFGPDPAADRWLLLLSLCPTSTNPEMTPET
jgi:hypothetical protein